MTEREHHSPDLRAIEVMRREIDSIPTVIGDQVDRLRPQLRDLAIELGPDLDEIVLTGCGDSHFAGVATRLAFERIAGVRCRAIEALELARYDVRYVPTRPKPLLVAISYSGEVGRTIEAAATAESFGWDTMALTGRAEGRLAANVRRPVLMTVPTLGFSPGTSTYVAMVTALLVFVAEIARARGRTAEAAALDHALARAPGLASATLTGAEPSARAAGDAIAASPVTTFLGAGPSRAAAAFGAAKLFEGPQRYGVVQDLEEWAHEQYFISGPATPIVVVAPSGASHDRAVELLDEMAFIGAPAFLISDAPPPRTIPTERYLPVSAGLDEAASGLLTCLPLALIGFFVSEILGTRSYGFPTPDYEREHYETIHRDTRGVPA
jgi:glucosamine--fructose-6-phosphate aminotransferase (isomerizing)